jgi:hypothetical protein
MSELVTALDQVPEMPWKYKLAYLVHKFSQMPQSECPVEHRFDGDEYIREMRIPAGTLFIGRVHNHGHLVQLVAGDVVNITEVGKQALSAPFEFHSAPGYQAVFYAVTDVVGRTVHKNPLGLTDWKLLEDRDFDSLESLLARGQMVAGKLLEAV